MNHAKPYPDLEAAMASKRSRAGGVEAYACAIDGCGPVHLRPVRAHVPAARKPARDTGPSRAVRAVVLGAATLPPWQGTPRPGWRGHAACRRGDPEVWFPPPPLPEPPPEAMAACAACPVRPDCLAWALATRQRHGVWGGLTETQRRNLGRRERRRLARRQEAA